MAHKWKSKQGVCIRGIERTCTLTWEPSNSGRRNDYSSLFSILFIKYLEDSKLILVKRLKARQRIPYNSNNEYFINADFCIKTQHEQLKMQRQPFTSMKYHKKRDNDFLLTLLTKLTRLSSKLLSPKSFIFHSLQ